MKELIEEKFGAGIMSAIDFTRDIERFRTRKVTASRQPMNGKFLPSKQW
jgi:cyanate lyase